MSKTALRDEIRKFHNSKGKLAFLLIAIGILGLLLPILPGVAMILLGVILLFPRQGTQIRMKVRELFNLSR